jgi:uncharacterized membrane protein AbrB (regulator of aidB expression)
MIYLWFAFWFLAGIVSFAFGFLTGTISFALGFLAGIVSGMLITVRPGR